MSRHTCPGRSDTPASDPRWHRPAGQRILGSSCYLESVRHNRVMVCQLPRLFGASEFGWARARFRVQWAHVVAAVSGCRIRADPVRPGGVLSHVATGARSRTVAMVAIFRSPL